jgi:FKBP-type peptidyl-prolyl cis-trans isomerase FklB
VTKNKEEGDAFLAANKAKPDVVTLPSGLQYKILQAGDGPKPTAADTVNVNYRGTLLDSTEFDSSAKTGKPATFQVGRVIKGWTEALQLMPAGSKWELYIPPSLAYGERGTQGGPIGPNSTLIFQVELLSIQPKPTPPPPRLEQPGGQPAPATPQPQGQQPQAQPQQSTPPPSQPKQ